MPTISFTVSAGTQTELVDALCAEYGYQSTVNGSPNPETRNQFAVRHVREWMKARIRTYREAQAKAQASSADPDIT